MSHWILRCPHCHESFPHSEIAPRVKAVPYDPLWPPKPDFPVGGLSLDCPNCRVTTTYQRFELMYSDA
jgi:hypothetical protein